MANHAISCGCLLCVDGVDLCCFFAGSVAALPNGEKGVLRPLNTTPATGTAPASSTAPVRSGVEFVEEYFFDLAILH